MTDEKPSSEYTSRANLTILGSFTGLFCTVGFLNSFGAFEEYYAKNQLANKSESTIAWLGALSIFFVFSVSVVSGPLLDAFGPRLLLYVGSFGTIFSIMMTSLCKEFYQFILAQGILLGASLALLVCPMLALVGQYIKVKRGAAMGIVIAGSSLGGVIWPIVINELLKKPTIRFEWTMRIVGFIMIPLLAISCLCCRPPKIPTATKRLQDKPDANEAVTPEREPVSTPKTRFSILREPKMQVTCLAFFITYFGMFSPFFFTTSYAVAQGFSTDLSFYTISIINGASLFGRIIPGILADRYGRFNICILATLLSGIIALCWTTATSVAGLVIWSAAYGFTSGVRLGLALVHFIRNADTLQGHSLPSTSLCSPNCDTKHLGLINRCCHGIYIPFRNGRHPYQWRTGWQVRISVAFYLLRCQPLSRYFVACRSTSDAESGFASIRLRSRNMQQ